MSIHFADLEHARAFSPSFVDVPSLNAEVTEHILRSIDAVRGATSQVPAVSLLVLGPAGTGKTHLFERLRRRTGPKATFVHIRPELGIEASMKHVLLSAMDALKQRVANQEYTQLDLVVGSALARAANDNPRFPSAFLERAHGMTEAEREALLQATVDAIERADVRVDSAWLELFLRVPFMKSDVRRAAHSWLSGREPSEFELRRIGHPSELGTERAKPALHSLAAVAAPNAPLVIVFDQLENLAGDDDDQGQVHAHARLLAELFDEVSRVVLVQMTLDGVWRERIRPALTPAERSRLEANELHVVLPRPPELEELLRRWIERLPVEKPRPVFPAPFGEAGWKRLLASVGVTPRQLFQAARRALEGGEPFQVPAHDTSAALPELEDSLKAHWEAELEAAHREIDAAHSEKRGVDETRLIAALGVLLRHTPAVDVSIATPGKAKKAESLRFVDGGKPAFVYVVQSTNGRSVATTLERKQIAGGPTTSHGLQT